ncbi:MAG: zinc ABC transporter substrate-binding protein [Cellulomonadaceae bacterium]|jgi:zinc transport system substrate-binding protein|nr:zinc ABC transporter substrate-binding protein [Cellulomonadaceae bacterium]
MLKRRVTAVVGALAALPLALSLSGCGAPGTASAHPADASGTPDLTVLTSFYPLQFVAEQVAGDLATVDNLTPPAADPHNLELSMARAREISTADVVLTLSGFSAAVDEAIAARNPDRLIDAADIVDLLSADVTGGHDCADHDHGHSGSDHGDDEDCDHAEASGHSHDDCDEPDCDDTHDHAHAHGHAHGHAEDYGHAEEVAYAYSDAHSHADSHAHSHAHSEHSHSHSHGDDCDDPDCEDKETHAGSGGDETDIATTMAATDDHSDNTDHSDHNHASMAGMDPHFWLDPTKLAQLADPVAEQLSAASPENADTFTYNAAELVARLFDLDHEIMTALAPFEGAKLVTNHTAFGYLAVRYNLEQVGITGIDHEIEPSPARLREIGDVVRANNVTTIFYETLVSPRVVQTLANDLGVNAGVLDTLEGITQPMIDAGDDYFTVMARNLDALVNGLNAPS